MTGITYAVIHQVTDDEKLTFSQANHLIAMELTNEDRVWMIKTLFKRDQIELKVRNELYKHYGL